MLWWIIAKARSCIRVFTRARVWTSANPKKIVNTGANRYLLLTEQSKNVHDDAVDVSTMSVLKWYILNISIVKLYPQYILLSDLWTIFQTQNVICCSVEVNPIQENVPYLLCHKVTSFCLCDLNFTVCASL